MTLASMLPAVMLPEYIKYVLAIEDWTSIYFLTMGVVLASIFIAIPLIVTLARRVGKAKVLAGTCVVEGTIFLVMLALPPSAFLASGSILLYALALFVGFGMAASFVLPDSMLSDIIDYDELHTRARSEGLYTVVETNLQQFVEITGGVLPALIQGAYGFVNLGGCSCGCAVACPEDYLRWNCPADIGYACSSGFSGKLLYGELERAAPCTRQNEQVQWVIRVFFLGLPGLMYLLAAYPARLMSISKTVHNQIISEIKSHRSNPDKASSLCPLTRRRVSPPPNTADSLKCEHFTPREWRLAARRRGASTLVWLVAGRLGLWLLLSAALFAAMASTGGNPNVVTLASLGLAALFVLIPYDILRLRNGLQEQDCLNERVAKLRNEREAGAEAACG